MGLKDNKVVIMVHGLAAKPPKPVLESLWRKALIENIRVESPQLAKELDLNADCFEMAYWANATPHHVEDDKSNIKKLTKQVDAVIKERQIIKNDFHVGTGDEVGHFFGKRGLDLVHLIAGALSVKMDVMKRFFRETQLYHEDQYIADKMRQPLEDSLRKAWDQDKEVALVTHSMGSFIAYDVLWRFSHRAPAEFSRYKKSRIKLFNTLGSPLGDAAIQALLFSQYHSNKQKRQYPTNIDYWHNYACLGDAVAHFDTFDETYFSPMKKLKIFPYKPKYRTIDYVNLHNPFTVVSRSGSKKIEKRNPHKSYGYLVQPRLGSWLADFFQDKLKS